MLKIQKEVFQARLAAYIANEWDRSSQKLAEEITNRLDTKRQLTSKEVFREISAAFAARRNINADSIIVGILKWIDENDYYDFREEEE